MKNKHGFTLVEVLMGVGIVAVLLAAVVYLLNPSQLLKQGADGNRVAAIGTLDKAIGLYYSSMMDNPSALFMGSSSVIYVSIPDPAATSSAGTNCAGVGFVSTASTTYHCAAPSNYIKTDGTGWIPINFNASSIGSGISALPVDPVNTTSSNEYYAYITNGAGGYELLANPQSIKDASDTADFVKGSSLALLTTFPASPSGNGGGGASSTITGIAVSCSPSSLNTSATSTCTATVTGTGSYSSAVSWSVSGGGSIGSSSGIFTAPGSAGTSTITACSTQSGYTSVCNTGSIAISLPAQNIWVTDAGNNRIQEFSSTGTYESQFGSVGTGNGQFTTPVGIGVDPSGNIWVTDSSNKRVEEFSSAGTYESQIGCASGACSATSTNGGFNGPSGVAIDSIGNIWVVDVSNKRVEEFSSTGTYESQFGSVGTGNGQFTNPVGIGIDPSGNIWVGDNTNSSTARIQEFSSTGTYESQFVSWNGTIGLPVNIGVGNGNIYVSQVNKLGSPLLARVQVFSPTGTYESQFGSPGLGDGGSGNGEFGHPIGIAVDAGGNIWVVDGPNGRVEEFSSTGTYESQFGSTGTNPGQFTTPTYITIH
jgi:prepilin-type N-terminal cleavage/methylation domain-containing protein